MVEAMPFQLPQPSLMIIILGRREDTPIGITTGLRRNLTNERPNFVETLVSCSNEAQGAPLFSQDLIRHGSAFAGMRGLVATFRGCAVICGVGPDGG